MQAGKRKNGPLQCTTHTTWETNLLQRGERVSISAVLHASLKCRRAGGSVCHPTVNVDTRHDDVWVIAWDEDDGFSLHHSTYYTMPVWHGFSLIPTSPEKLCQIFYWRNRFSKTALASPKTLYQTPPYRSIDLDDT